MKAFLRIMFGVFCILIGVVLVQIAGIDINWAIGFWLGRLVLSSFSLAFC